MHCTYTGLAVEKRWSFYKGAIAAAGAGVGGATAADYTEAAAAFIGIAHSTTVAVVVLVLVLAPSLEPYCKVQGLRGKHKRLKFSHACNWSFGVSWW